ncbi:MAG TPA: hypothetical protein VFI45_00910 [Candidatus Acidoferrum sp.]|nr:hypothetical protein [Candidatus Acidoferrum sp.]
MPPRTRILLIAMSISFGLCILGLMAGMCYNLFAVIAHHRPLDQTLGNSILFYKILGGFGVLGFLLFFAFLISSIAGQNRPPKG